VFNLLGISSTAAQQLAYARQVAATLAVPASREFPGSLCRSGERIRIGYLSSDFRALPTAYLTVGLIEHHDRQGFEVIGYSAGVDDRGAMRRRVVAAFDRFVDVSKIPDLEAARLIHSDSVDVLIDLNGYKPENRAKILAHRPAPIQVNCLGYPGTMGADFVDYILVDRFVVPADQQTFFNERLVHLPHCYQCNDDKREIAVATPSRVECGLPEKGFVFCCFNDSYKITPDFFDIWMRLLQTVPGSVMWLFERGTVAKENLAREAAARSVPPERLVFAQRLPLSEHLARHRLADLFLDTLPYNAHTTASDALWAGLPVLTCAGSTFAGRVAGSLLRAVGLDELITTSLEEYEALALRLACDSELLDRLRARLARNRLTFPLFDTERSTRALEAAYIRMCEIRRAGRSPTAFSISPSGGCS
jgi:protein O-GlcNAc transferase